MDPQTTSEKSFLEKFGPKIFVALVFLLPVFIIPSSIVPLQTGKSALIFIISFSLFIVWLINKVRDGAVSVFWSPILTALSALIVVYFLSAIFSASVVQGIIGRGFEIDTALSLLSLSIAVFMVPQLFRTKQSLFNVYLALFVSFFVIFIFSFIRILAGPGIFSFGILTSEVSNLVGSWNDLGIFFGLFTVLSLVMLEIAPPKGVLRIMLYIATALSVIAVSVVDFNVVWYSLAAFSLAVFLYSFAFARFFNFDAGTVTSFKDALRLPKSTMIVFLVSVIFIITGSQSVSEKYPSLDIGNHIATVLNLSQLEARPSWATTFGIAGNTLKTDPILGAGPNQFSFEWMKYRPQVVNESAFWNIDFNFGIGIIPSVVVSTGVLGLLAWVVFLVLFFYHGVLALRRPREDIFAYYLSATSFIGALYLWTMAIFYTTSTVPFALAFILTGAFVASLGIQGNIQERIISLKEEPGIRFAALVITIILVILSAGSLFIFGQRNISLAYFNHALRDFNATGNLESSERNVRRAIAVSGDDVYYRGLSEIALLNLNNVVNQVSASTPPEEIRERFQLLLGGAIQSAQAARDANPANYQNWVSLARVYEVVVPLKIATSYENAKAAYEEAVKRNPTSPAVQLLLARLEMLNNNNDGAREFIKQALELKRNYTEAIFLLSQIEVAEGNLRAAIESVESASVIAPNDPTVFFQLGFLHYNDSSYQKAIAALERAVALEPAYANARYFLGLSYDRVGKKKEATAEFEQIEKTNPTNDEVKFILRNLRAGRSAFSNVQPPLDDSPEDRDKPPISEDNQSGDL